MDVLVFEMQSNLKFPSGRWGPRLSFAAAAGAPYRGVPGRSMLTATGIPCRVGVVGVLVRSRSFLLRAFTARDSWGAPSSDVRWGRIANGGELEAHRRKEAGNRETHTRLSTECSALQSKARQVALSSLPSSEWQSDTNC